MAARAAARHLRAPLADDAQGAAGAAIVRYSGRGVSPMAHEIARGITVDADVMVGKPVIKGTRMPVDLVLAKLSANPSVDDLLADYPHLTAGQIMDCLHYDGLTSGAARIGDANA
jgi:uncharacterized protein (DUF433 family)